MKRIALMMVVALTLSFSAFAQALAEFDGGAFQAPGSPRWDPIVQLGAGTGYIDTNSRTVVRTAEGVVYMVSVNTPYNVNSGGQVQMFKGRSAGSPTAFDLMDAAHEPTCSFRAAGVEARMADDGIIHVAADCSSGAEAGYAQYIQFKTATDTWGPIRNVGGPYHANIRRYESKIGLALDANKKPWVLWGAYGNVSFNVSTITSGTYPAETWGINHSLPDAGAWRPSTQFDSAGNLHIAILADSWIHYYQRIASSGTWIGPETVAVTPPDDMDTGGGVVDSGPSLAIDNQNRPLVTWTGAETAVTGHLRIRTAANTWSDVTLPTCPGSGCINGHGPIIQFDVGGNLYYIEGHQMCASPCPTGALQAHVNWRLDSTQTWHTFDALAPTASPDRDGGGGGRYDKIWNVAPNDLDYVTMVEDPNDAGQLAYIHGVPASAGTTLQASTPSCSPGSGTYVSAQTVTCTNPNSGTTVMCSTTNATTPVTNDAGTGCTTGTQYSTAITVRSAATLKVVAGTSTLADSSAASYTYAFRTATTTTLTSSLNPSTYGQAATFTAVVTSKLGAPPDGETVSFMKGTTVLGMEASSGGSASFTTSTLKVGSNAIKAVYGGDTNFAASTSKAVSQVVGKATTTTALVSSLNPSQVGQAVTFTASVTPELGGKVTGTVTLYDGTTALKTTSVSGGVAKFTTKTLTSGTHSITATYNVSTSFDGSSASLTQTVN